MSKQYNRGERVQTPMGPGVVNYVRMEPPTFAFPSVYSILLDSNKDDQLYGGTIFDANVVSDIPASEVVKEIAAWMREENVSPFIIEEMERRWGEKK